MRATKLDQLKMYPSKQERTIMMAGGVGIVESRFLDCDHIGHAFDKNGKYLKEILLY